MPAALSDNLSYCVTFKVALYTSFGLRVIVSATGTARKYVENIYVSTDVSTYISRMIQRPLIRQELNSSKNTRSSRRFDFISNKI